MSGGSRYTAVVNGVLHYNALHWKALRGISLLYTEMAEGTAFYINKLDFSALQYNKMPCPVGGHTPFVFSLGLKHAKTD